MKRQIVNIINFVRGCEPRIETDLITPVKEQIRLLNKYDLPSTFLIQYDALINDEFLDVLKTANAKTEFGVWLEVVQPQCEAAGVVWRGRKGFPWDWHANAGFTVAYSQADREKLVDVLFEKYKEVFGKYPRCIGSWAIDAHTYEYMQGKYEIDAACTCRDQWGTDGYTFWGGYYNQAYYPSKYNMLCPAQTDEAQVNIPVFRMLGSDPIYQYDMGLDVKNDAADWQGVATLEPVYCGKDGGGNTDWVDWYFDENFGGRCIEFGYTQAGQENSFGWGAMRIGIMYQFLKIAYMTGKNEIEALTLGETGRWFKENFKKTPATVVSALTDRHKKGRSSVWYDCINYRCDVYTEKGYFNVRDIYLFRETYCERYLNSINDSESMIFDNLPFVDGNRFSGNGIRAGLYPMINGEKLTHQGFDYSEEGKKVTMTFHKTEAGEFKIEMDEEGVTFEAEKDFVLDNISKGASNEPAKELCGNTLNMVHEGFEYSVTVSEGKFDDETHISSKNGKVRIICK